MKKIYAILAAVAAFVACNMADITVPGENSFDWDNFKFDIQVPDPYPGTKGTKSSWADGDIIYMWFDDWGDPEAEDRFHSYPDLSVKYDAEEGVWNLYRRYDSFTPLSSGLFQGLYLGDNGLYDYDEDLLDESDEFYLPCSYGEYCGGVDVAAVPMTIEFVEVSYTMDGSVLKADLRNREWYWTQFRVLLKTNDANLKAKANNFYLQVYNETADEYAHDLGQYIFMNPGRGCPGFDMQGTNDIGITEGVADKDGIAFYYSDFTATNADITFKLTEEDVDKDGKVYTVKNKTIDASDPKRCLGVAINFGSFGTTQVTPEYVDLGLSVKWATFNVGATKPEEYGDYYAWGATSTQTSYAWLTAPFNEGDGSYNDTAWNNAKSGAVDSNGNLLPANDVAHEKWGGNWRMPTGEEWTELRTKCEWTWTYNYNSTRIAGTIVTGSNGNSIFLPAAGYRYFIGLYNDDYVGYYWSSSLDSDDSSRAWDVYFNFGDVCMGNADRLYGNSVRPVYEEPVTPEYVDLGLSVKWATFNVGATKPEEYGDYYAWGETEPYYVYGDARSASPTWRSGKTGYNWASYKWCNGTNTTMTKYCVSSDYGTVDNKTALEEDDDVAHKKWGGNWRMPTIEEWTELRTKCTWTWTDNYKGTGVKGEIVTGNGNSIFLPAAGYRFTNSQLAEFGLYGRYWSSSLYRNNSSGARCASFYSKDFTCEGFDFRYDGRTVRPVSK